MADVLVTGGGGFIGTRLCDRLLADGATVYAASRRPVQSAGDGVQWRSVDLSDYGAVRTLLAAVEPSAILHLAGHVTGAREVDAVLPTLHGNLVATVNVLTAAHEIDSGRVVLAGSMEEPEPGEVPSSPYAVSKWAAGAYARMFRAVFETSVTTLRIFMVYGPGQREPTRIVPYVGLALLRGEAPRLSSGTRPVDWVYVDDVVDAFVRAAWSDEAVGEVIDVGSGRLVTIRQLVEHLVHLTGSTIEPQFGALPDRPLETSHVADLGRASALLGWSPQTSLEEGLARTVEWLRTSDLAPESGDEEQ